MMKCSIFCFLIATFFVSCTIENLSIDDKEIHIMEKNDIVSFKLSDITGKVYTPFIINDSTIHVNVGELASLQSLSLHLEHRGKTALIDGSYYYEGITRDYGNFVNPHKITIVSSNGEHKDRLVLIYNLPVLVINTPDNSAITSKETYTNDCGILFFEGPGKLQFEGNCSIKGRGNSTWLLPKKPYNLKLDKKFGFFGLPSSKHWVLLANAYWDRTQMHNAIAYEMARLTDYPWVQSGKFVELIINGVYQGLYFLCEKIRVEKNRINIEVMESTETASGLRGGYLLETAFTPDKNTFQTELFNKTDAGNPLYYEIIEPDETLNHMQIDIIKDDLTMFEDLISKEIILHNGLYRQFFDIESAINWMLVNEVACNQETLNPSNLFIYRDKGGLITIGPPWDFDAHTFGVYGEHRIFLNRPTFWFYWMMKDPVFVERLKEKWKIYKTLWIEHIPSFIDELYIQIYQSALRNEQMWPDWYPMYGYPIKDYLTLIEEMKVFFEAQINYVDDYINSLKPY